MASQLPNLFDTELSLVWQGECCIGSLPKRHAELIAASHASRPVTLDLSEVSKIDTAGLQLLLVFVRECEQLGTAVRWHGTSLALKEAAQVTGLRGALGLADND